MDKLKIRVNGQVLQGEEGESIMNVANRNGIHIIGLCYCKDIKPESSCRLCLVSIKGRKGLHTACNTKIEDGMEIETENEEIKKTRNTNFELIFSRHCQNCVSCRRKNHCKILDIAKKCDFDLKKKKSTFSTKMQFGPAISYDSSKCINCNNCVQVCNNQGVGFLQKERIDGFSKIATCKGKECVFCGQCLSHCPSGAFEEVSSIAEVKNILGKKNNYVVFQFSSGMIMSLCKELGDKWDISSFSRALKLLGADMVFDTSYAVDIIIEKESSAFIYRAMNNEKKCLFTSHCPSWVRYIKTYHPELKDCLSKNKSPHIVCGAAIKNYLFKKGRKEKNIYVVSVAPCTSKKFEILEKSSFFGKDKSVDFSLTLSEMYALLKDLDIEKVKKQDFKNVFIKSVNPYNSNEDIVRMGIKLFCEKTMNNEAGKIEFKKINGIENGSEAEIISNGRKIKVGIVYGLGEAKKIVDDLKKDIGVYDYLEVMACPKGCLGGGGQTLGDLEEISYSCGYFVGPQDNSLIKEIFTLTDEEFKKIGDIDELD